MPTNDREIAKIKEYLASERFRKSREMLRAISGQVRYKILGALIQSKDGLTVSEMAKIFGYSVSRVSHQLRILRKYKVVTMQRNGKSMTYRMGDSTFLHQIIDKWRSQAYKML